ncbi:hypothetical protein [Cytobacillus praedii]|uniref:hypothetical protein n=1 Tax=Cytobacillus praedii TaxID=1742358 RepID=UPI003AF94318
MKFIDPSTLSGGIPPYSFERYKQLGNLQGIYKYTWNSLLQQPNGESIFDKEAAKMIINKKVLDVGCGHGDFTLKCRLQAKEIVGFNVTENFIKIG